MFGATVIEPMQVMGATVIEPMQLLGMPDLPTLVGLGLGGFGAVGTGPISSRVSLPGDAPAGAGMAQPSTGTAIAGVVIAGVVVAAMVGFGLVYNQWAYDDWSCIIKNCTQTSTKRR